jgi:hypothetical protein
MLMTAFLDFFEVELVSKDAFCFFFEFLVSQSQLLLPLLFFLLLELLPSNLSALSLDIKCCLVVQNVVLQLGLSFFVQLALLLQLLLGEGILSFLFKLAVLNPLLQGSSLLLQLCSISRFLMKFLLVYCGLTR